MGKFPISHDCAVTSIDPSRSRAIPWCTKQPKQRRTFLVSAKFARRALRAAEASGVSAQITPDSSHFVRKLSPVCANSHFQSPNAIRKIVVGCWRDDLWLLRTCVGSIRYWYPEIEIALLKDVGCGDFDTSELERCWGVTILDPERPVRYGSPVSKFEVFYRKTPERVLFLDSDIILVGPVLEALDGRPEDVIVSADSFASPEAEHIAAVYYNWNEIKKLDPAFRFPGYVFNTGQFVARGGLIDRHEVERFYDPPHSGNLRWPEIFTCYGDQSVLNYLLPKLEQEGKLTIGRVPFKIFAHPTCIGPDVIPLESQKSRRGLAKLIHYAGDKLPLNCQRLRPDLLNFFEAYYYSRVRFGPLKRRTRALTRLIRWFPRYYSRQIYQRFPTRLRKMAKHLHVALIGRIRDPQVMSDPSN